MTGLSLAIFLMVHHLLHPLECETDTEWDPRSAVRPWQVFERDREEAMDKTGGVGGWAVVICP